MARVEDMSFPNCILYIIIIVVVVIIIRDFKIQRRDGDKNVA